MTRHEPLIPTTEPIQAVSIRALVTMRGEWAAGGWMVQVNVV